MKRMMKKAAMILAIAIMVIPLAGCSNASKEEEDRPKALALVVGNHTCSRELNLNSPLILDAVSETIADYGFISVVSVDGAPWLVAADSYDIPEQYKKASESKLRADAKNKAHNLMMQVVGVRADDSEVDTLEAIRIAVRSFDSAEEMADRKIIVVDTGWSTTGLMNFGNNLLNGDPAAVAKMLDEKNAIPDLSGTTVIWQQMGDVASPQQELSPSQVLVLKSIWEAVIEKGGGKFECRETVANNGIIGGSLPEVTAIALPREEPVKFDAAEMDLGERIFDEPVFFDEGQIRFEGDSDVYAEPEKATECLEPVAEFMKSHADFRLLLAGTTAGDSDSQYVRELSKARADAVKRSLLKMGVEEERVVTTGLGNGDPWHIYGVGTKGDLAAQNRKVVMLGADSDTAAEIMGMKP